MRVAGPVGFDLDLTLINSRPAIMAAWRAVAGELRVSINLSEVDRRMGIKLEDEVAYWFPADRQADAAASYRRHYVRLAPKLTFPLPGAAEAVGTVRAAGERAVVITAKHPVSVRPSLVAVGLQPDEVIAHVHGPEKAAVLARLGAAVYVGDTPADMAAAEAGGAVAVGVPTGSFSPAELVAAGAQVVLGSLTEFPPWYARFRHDLSMQTAALPGGERGQRARSLGDAGANTSSLEAQMTTDGIDPAIPPSGTGCVECEASSGWWLHLRRCAQCGHIGCCDTSPSQHATKHAKASGHHVIRSFEPGEAWFWDYQGEEFHESGPALAPPEHHPVDQGVPGPHSRVPHDWQSHLH